MGGGVNGGSVMGEGCQRRGGIGGRYWGVIGRVLGGIRGVFGGGIGGRGQRFNNNRSLTQVKKLIKWLPSPSTTQSPNPGRWTRSSPRPRPRSSLCPLWWCR